MTASKALETLNWTTPTAPATLVDRAERFLDTLTADAPLRYKVAARTIIREFR